MDINEINRLAAMASSLRPDWPAKSLRTFLERNMSNRAYGDVAVALAWVCTRTRTDTPRLLLEAGAWWKATATETGGSPRPPKREEACETCGLREGLHLGNPVLGDHSFRPLAPTRYAEDDARNGVMGDQNRAPADAARAELASARTRLCTHGIARNVCADCPTDPTDPPTEETA